MGGSRESIKLWLVVLITLLCEAYAASTACGNGNGKVYENGDGSRKMCLEYVKSKTTWSKARDNCKSKLGSLVTIRDEVEQAIINSVRTTGSYCWIGLSDTYKEGTYQWEANRAIASYKNWRPKQPDNKGGHEDCGEVYPDGRWNDIGCSSTRPDHFMCEYPREGGTCGQNGKMSGVLYSMGTATMCLKKVTSSSTHETARKGCKNLGGYLTSIRNSDEEAIVKSISGSDRAYIGINDKAKEGTYVWGVNQQKAVYTNWGRGEPNNAGGKEDCAESNYNAWNDVPCGFRARYVCEFVREGGACGSPQTVGKFYTLGSATMCLKLVKKKLAWTGARDACAALGGWLVSIRNAHEQAIVASMNGYGMMWVGLSDSKSEGVWTWDEDGLPVSYTNWIPGQPDNHDKGEDYGHLHGEHDGLWNDVEDSSAAIDSYMCQFIPHHPTGEPTSQPSGRPSSQPSTQPSSAPSTQPSSSPSSAPSTQPSSAPSTQPSSSPSSAPSTQPSSAPSTQPSSAPSSMPSSEPTSGPTSAPSSAPSYLVARPCRTTADCLRANSECFANECVCSRSYYLLVGLCERVPAGYIPTRSSSSAPSSSDGVPLGATGISPCSPGKHAQSGDISCSACPGGSYTDTYASPTCHICDFGKVKDAAETDTACESCTPGFYAPTQGLQKCLPCTVGSYQPDVGVRNCISCPIGTASDIIASTTYSCRECPAGTYASAGQDVCSVTPPGSFTPSGAGDPEACPPGRYAPEGQGACMDCPRSTYAEEFGSAECRPCVPGRITPGVASTSADQCVSPESNFITAIVTLAFVIMLAWEYVVRGRFPMIAFMRKQRVINPLLFHAQSITTYIYRYHYKGEAQRIYVTSFRILRVIIFGFLGTLGTCLMAFATYFAVIANLVFKGMIIVVGMKIDVPFISKLETLARTLAATVGMNWLYFIFEPFVKMIVFLAQFQIDLDSVNVTCSGASAPIKLVINLFAMGVVIVLIESDFALFKAVTHDGLTDTFSTTCLNVFYRTWSPSHFEQKRKSETKPPRLRALCGSGFSKTAQYVSTHFFVVIFITTIAQGVNSADLFQNSLQFLASKVVLVDFISVNYVAHSWDPNCNVVRGYPYFDTMLAVSSSAVAWLLFLPAIYEMSTLLIPGLPRCVSPLAEKEQRSVGSLHWNRFFREVWKYSSLVAPDLWWAELSYKWIAFVGRHTPYEVGPRAPSVAQVEALVIDPGGVGNYGDEEDKQRVSSIARESSAYDDASFKSSDVQPYESEPTPEEANEHTGQPQVQKRRRKSEILALQSRNSTFFNRSQPGLAGLELSYMSKKILRALEKPERRLFRIILSSNVASQHDPRNNDDRTNHMLRLFTCDKKINETMVWSEVAIDTLQGDAFYTLLVINKINGAILENKSYRAWDFDDCSSIDEITRDMKACVRDSAIVFIKWGTRPSNGVATALAEGALLRMTTPNQFLHAAGVEVADSKAMKSTVTSPLHLIRREGRNAVKDGAVPPKDLEQGEEAIIELQKINDKRRKSRKKRRGANRQSNLGLGQMRGTVMSASGTDKQAYLDFLAGKSIQGESRSLLNMAEAIAWCGGDASKIPSTVSYILLGTSLQAYSEEERNELVAKQSIGYQQWHTEQWQIFESSLQEVHDVSVAQDYVLGTHKLAHIVFTTPSLEDHVESRASADGRLHLIDDDQSQLEARLCFNKRSFIISTLRGRSDGESALWRARNQLGLPSYLALLRLELDEMKSWKGFGARWCLYIPSYLRTLLVVLGMGHVFTSTGRKAFYVVVWKYIHFILLCCGYWTDELVEMYDLHRKMRNFSLVWSHPFFKLSGNQFTLHNVDVKGSSGGSETNGTHLSGDTEAEAEAEAEAEETVAETVAEKRPVDEEEAKAGKQDASTRFGNGLYGMLSEFIHHMDETEMMSRLPEQTLKKIYQSDYSTAIATIVSTRASVLQLVPGLAVLSIFAALTSSVPMLVFSKDLELSLPEIVIRDARGVAHEIEEEYTRAVNHIKGEELNEEDYCMEIPQDLLNAPPSDTTAARTRQVMELHNKQARRRMRACLRQEPLLLKEWVVNLRTLMLLMSHSRLIKLVFQLTQFTLILAMLFAMEDNEKIRRFAMSSLVLILPWCIITSLRVYIALGKMVGITDDDLVYFWNTVRTGLYWCVFCVPCAADHSVYDGDDEDEVPPLEGEDKSVQRQSRPRASRDMEDERAMGSSYEGNPSLNFSISGLYGNDDKEYDEELGNIGASWTNPLHSVEEYISNPMNSNAESDATLETAGVELTMNPLKVKKIAE